MKKLKYLMSLVPREEFGVFVFALMLSIFATWYSFANDIIVSYGDAESHLNIAKRVVDSVTPGFAQLGGIWLPLPHVLMLPFVKFDFLWRTGLAGSIVSGLAFIISSVFIYKLAHLLTNNKAAAFVAALVFMLNPNVLYLQSTPMTELTLIVFFVLSGYYFVRFIKNQDSILDLIFAALFGFLATLSRYDGWFLVLIEALILVLLYVPWRKIVGSRAKMEGYIILFATLAFFGILGWLFWDFIILGDPFYFTHSQFSAKSQQTGWLVRGQLPAYKNLWVSFLYYTTTSVANIGIFISAASLIGFFIYLFYRPSKQKFLIALLFSAAFLFYVITLYMGQSIIFIRPLTPLTFEWTLFNVRYGVMMVPIAAIFFGYLFSKIKYLSGKTAVAVLIILQTGLFATGFAKVISKDDGIIGLSSQKLPNAANNWIRDNYDYGMVLMDDYARTISIVKSGIPMQEMIYIGNKPYWEESLNEPEKYARWIVMQTDDEIWDRMNDPGNQARLYKYFQKVYTSPDILIFKRNETTEVVTTGSRP